ncbi:hypothetical protein MSAN_00060200 [Mycena sanguinolenta]|uniref:Zn(2)-C6 fungal-type domain-containing protein n=1 Tax=Mycena sanguinolenta TaxID=230812 RepID=A0A8H6ZHK7_9AGAR|nr:hypothetical protein MSAN_00060200 [Mycena sanguinolenta]
MQKTPATQNLLVRGGACIFCRKRKVKCDGVRPACGRCSGVGRAQDCEYPDRSGRTEGEQLEASIASLERKILQLGGTLPTSPEILIHEPHLEGMPPGSSFSSWSNRNRADRLEHEPRIEITLPQNWWQTPVPPPGVVKILMDLFARHASQFGFFLNGPRIMSSVFSPDSRRPISPSLLNSILLFGIHLSSSPALQAGENEFLNRAIRSVAPIQPHQATQNIQAEVLLAQYFLREGRFIEAMHRINTATSLAIGCGLHRLPGPHIPRSPFVLPSTRDAVEQGERINAFWMIMALHKIFSVIMQWPSSVSDILNQQIDLPWPLEMEVYESGIVPVNPQRQFTMTTFLGDPMAANFEAANSSLAQYSKAVALFERASYIGVNRTNLADPEEYAQFTLFEHGLIQVIQILPSFDNFEGRIDTIRQRLVTFTLCQVAVIQLHSAFDNPSSIHKCLNAARAVVAANQRIPNMQVWEHIDSTMGTLWVAVCQIIIRGIAAIKNPRAASRGWIASVSNGDYSALKSALVTMTDTMLIFSPRCRLIDYQLNRVHESYRALCR